MGSDDNTTVGAIFTPSDQRRLLDPFDEATERVGYDSRSAAIKDAMEFYTHWLELYDARDLPWRGVKDAKGFCRQVFHDQVDAEDARLGLDT